MRSRDAVRASLVTLTLRKLNCFFKDGRVDIQRRDDEGRATPGQPWGDSRRRDKAHPPHHPALPRKQFCARCVCLCLGSSKSCFWTDRSRRGYERLKAGNFEFRPGCADEV